jgi:hypothetical protein
VKTRLQDRLRGSQRDRVAPDTGPMTGSINHQQPSTIRGEAQADTGWRSGGAGRRRAYDGRRLELAINLGVSLAGLFDDEFGGLQPA